MKFDALKEIISNRRSVYPNQYTDQPISKETILELLELGNWAPNHKKTEPWRFKIFHSEDARRSLSEYLGDAFLKANEGKDYPEIKYKKVKEKPLQSGCVVAICMQRDPEERLPEWEEIAAVSCAVQNMWLGCYAKGIGAYWSSISYILKADEFLQLEEGERCLGLFYMGCTDATPPQGARTPLSEKIQFK